MCTSRPKHIGDAGKHGRLCWSGAAKAEAEVAARATRQMPSVEPLAGMIWVNSFITRGGCIVVICGFVEYRCEAIPSFY